MRAYGYEADGKVRPAEAEVLRTLAVKLLDGGTVRGVTGWLNEQGYRTVSGHQWAPVVVRRMMVNPKISRSSTYVDGDGNPVTEPPIVAQDDYDAVVAILTDPARKGPTSPRSYLLSGGLAVCGRCGHQLVSRPSNGGRRGYVCRSGPPTDGCGRVRIAADPFEDEIVAMALARLASPRNRTKLAAALAAQVKDREKWTTKLAEIDAKLAEVGVDYADEKLGRTEFHAARDRLSQRRKAAERELADTRRIGVIGDLLSEDAEPTITTLLAWWAVASLEQRRALLALLIEKVTVNPVTRRGSRTFDPERLSVTWR